MTDHRLAPAVREAIVNRLDVLDEETADAAAQADAQDQERTTATVRTNGRHAAGYMGAPASRTNSSTSPSRTIAERLGLTGWEAEMANTRVNSADVAADVDVAHGGYAAWKARNNSEPATNSDGDDGDDGVAHGGYVAWKESRS